jgi:hypothetical protein
MKLENVLAELQKVHAKLLQIYWTMFFLRRIATIVISIVLIMHSTTLEIINLTV